jgi:hypothetical protein
MPTFQLRRFSRPEILKSIAPQTLTGFLKPYRRFLTSRGVALPPPGLFFELDYDTLIRAFLSPDAKTPRELIDALYIIDEMATSHGVDALLAEVERRGLHLMPGPDPTPEDVAVQVWLLDKDVLERMHAEHHLARVRSFESYQTDRSRLHAFRPPTEDQLAALADELDDWFEEASAAAARGSSCPRRTTRPGSSSGMVSISSGRKALRASRRPASISAL